MSEHSDGTFILGAGFTGLAIGYASGAPIFEATPVPGGLGASYYLKPGATRHLHWPPSDRTAYRFEVGGGHWIFGGDPDVLKWIEGLVPLRTYRRRASVFFSRENQFVPYPIQQFGDGVDTDGKLPAGAAFTGDTMREWMVHYFGADLCERFFHPFNDAYTAGYYDRIAPQDAYKSPRMAARAITNRFYTRATD